MKFRFVFGSDGGTTNEGWYIDNIMLSDSYQAIDPPTNLTAQVTSPNRIDLEWTAPDESPDSYNVYRSNSLTEPFILISESDEQLSPIPSPTPL